MTIPNILSLLRMCLVPFFLSAILYGKLWAAVILFAVAGITDGLDGFIAKCFNQKSPLGAILDPMADKIMLTAGFIVLTIPNQTLTTIIPLWLTIFVIARDVLIVVTALIFHLVLGVKNFPPSLPGKVSTFFQISYVVILLFVNLFNKDFLFGMEGVLRSAVFISTLLSGIHYIFVAFILSKE